MTPEKRPYVSVKVEVEGDEVKAYIWGTNMTPDNPTYHEFSAHALEFGEHFARETGKGLEIKLTLRDF